jgi:hypothetical protein
MSIQAAYLDGLKQARSLPVHRLCGIAVATSFVGLGPGWTIGHIWMVVADFLEMMNLIERLCAMSAGALLVAA